MTAILAAIGLLLASGAAALLAGKSRRWCTAFGAGGALGACAIGLVAALGALLAGGTESLRLVWEVPYGSFFVAVDALSAFFLVAIFAVCGAAALWGAEYWSDEAVKTPLGPAWFFFNLLIASMAMVVVARNAILFLMAWEAMAVASFFLVTLDDQSREVRHAGWL